MFNLKLHLLCNRIFVNSVCRHIRTDSALFKQYRKPGRFRKEQEPEPDFIDSGIGYRASLYKDDPEFMEQLSKGEADIEDLDIDFSTADSLHDEHYAELKRKKDKKALIIAGKKFFKPPKEPSMLTYNEKQHIKHLHAENPNEWDVKRLAESFPATEFIIKKILKAKWRPASVERIKQMDEKVARNWELLSSNQLEASSDLIQHCKKFVDRRETLLAQLKNKEFHKLPPIERKVKWECGEMTSILTQYEQQIDRLHQKQLEAQQNKLLYGNTENAIQKSSFDPRSVIRQEVESKKIMENFEEKDSFLLEEEQGSSEEVTLDFLENQIREKSKSNKPLSVFDKLILENSEKNKSISSDSSGLEFLSDVKSLESQEKQDQSSKPFPINEYLKKPKKKEKKLSKSEKPIDQNDFRKLKKSKTFEPETYNPFEEEEMEDVYNVKDEELQDKAVRLSEKDIYKKLEFSDNKPRLKLNNDIEDENEALNKENPKKAEGEIYSKPKIKLSYKANEYLEKARVDSDEADIADTCFWNDSKKKTKREKPAINQAALAEVAKSKSSFEEDNYPDKIEIPQKYVGSGKIFKIKDCYYDDNGEFLYRVPGMTGQMKQ